MVLWVILSLFDHFDPQKTEVSKLSGDIMDFLSLNLNIMSIQSFHFTLHVMLQEYEQDSLTFFMGYTIKVVRKLNNTDQTI